MKKQAIVFAYWVNNEFMGFRADTFGTISKEHPKIYGYSENQVKIITDNVKSELSRAGTGFIKKLAEKGASFQNQEGDNFESNSIVEHVSKNEQQLREWGKDGFEIRVHPFLEKDEEGGYPEKWKMDIEINNLKDPLEIYKFKLAENEN